jgi:hypothetical protein
MFWNGPAASQNWPERKQEKKTGTDDSNSHVVGKSIYQPIIIM